jgi:hypothetical protein
MMRASEFIAEGKSVHDQIIADVKKHGGDPADYFVRFTNADKLGYSARQIFSRTPDVDNPAFDVDYIGTGKGRLALWFYPLKTALDIKRGVYASEQPYAWLVRLKPGAWLQTVRRGDTQAQPAPQGQERVGILRMSDPPAAIFFKPAFDVIGRYYNYADLHQRHGEVKGRPAPTLFQRIRGDR